MPRTSKNTRGSANFLNRVLELSVTGAALCQIGKAAGRPVDRWAPQPGMHQLPTLLNRPNPLLSPAPQPAAAAPRSLVHEATPPPSVTSDGNSEFSNYGSAGPGCELTQNFSPCLVRPGHPEPQPAAAVKSIIGPLAWRMCQVDSCGNFQGNYDPSADIQLTYSFESSVVMHEQNMTSLDAPRRDVVRSAMADIERYIHLGFTEVGDAPAHIVYGQPVGDTLNIGEAAGGGEVLGQTNFLEADSTAILLISSQSLNRMTVCHETMHALGMVHPFSGTGMDGIKLGTRAQPETGVWLGDQSATILSYYAPPEWQGLEGPQLSRFAPLDWSALAYRYQTAPKLAGDTVYVFDDTFGVGAVHDDLGRNSLEAAGEAPVYLTLRNDGSTSLLNNTQVLRISPNSVFVRGDISQTGGTLQGNDLNNVLLGSVDDDVIETGGANTSVITGGGADVVIVSKDARHVHIKDFDVQAAQLIFEGAPAVTSIIEPNGELTLRAETGAQVHLPNAAGFDASRCIATGSALPRGQLQPAPLAPSTVPPARESSQAPHQGTAP